MNWLKWKELQLKLYYWKQFSCTFETKFKGWLWKMSSQNNWNIQQKNPTIMAMTNYYFILWLCFWWLLIIPINPLGIRSEFIVSLSSDNFRPVFIKFPSWSDCLIVLDFQKIINWKMTVRKRPQLWTREVPGGWRVVSIRQGSTINPFYLSPDGKRFGSLEAVKAHIATSQNVFSE